MNKKSKNMSTGLLVMGATLLVLCTLLTSCAQSKARTKIKALVVPKFEVDEMSGDFAGEAQLFYKQYCAGCKQVPIPNSTPTSQFYVNEETGVALLVTGSGKTAAGLSLASVLSCDDYDFSDTTIVSVGCGGGSTGTCVPGDVIVVSGACDAELGHRVDARELEDPQDGHTWFADESYNDYGSAMLNPELCEKAYQLVKDCPLRTTETTARVIAESYPDEEWATRKPRVAKGTALTGDCYWKGSYEHENAESIVKHYGCPDEYAVTEMEDLAIMNAARCFGLENRVISLRVIVNMDTFLKGESAESLWLDGVDYNEDVAEGGGETMDIFAPGMRNLFDTGRIVIDAVLAGEL